MWVNRVKVCVLYSTVSKGGVKLLRGRRATWWGVRSNLQTRTIHNIPLFITTSPKMPSSSASIAIIGAGSVGSSIAHSLLLRRLVGELILVDIDHARCRAQILDLSDASYLSNVRVRQGDPTSASQADIIIITAGAKQNPGETRLDLVDRNFKILKSVLGGMQPIRQDAVLLLVANPVDVLTHFAQKLSGLPRGQVLGSGTLLDSIRLRGQIAEKIGVG